LTREAAAFYAAPVIRKPVKTRMPEPGTVVATIATAIRSIDPFAKEGSAP
jgi:hypothetical protein